MGVQDSKRALEVETILTGSSMGDEAKKKEGDSGWQKLGRALS